MTADEVAMCVVIQSIREKWMGYDFTGEPIDDIWANQMRTGAVKYLTEEEVDCLCRSKDEDALAKGIDAVLAGFLQHLMNAEGLPY